MTQWSGSSTSRFRLFRSPLFHHETRHHLRQRTISHLTVARHLTKATIQWCTQESATSERRLSSNLPTGRRTICECSPYHQPRVISYQRASGRLRSVKLQRMQPCTCLMRTSTDRVKGHCTRRSKARLQSYRRSKAKFTRRSSFLSTAIQA